MSFSPDSKLLVAQGGAPEWNLVLWIWEKSKVASTFKTTNPTNSPVHQVGFAAVLHLLAGFSPSRCLELLPPPLP